MTYIALVYRGKDVGIFFKSLPTTEIFLRLDGQREQLHLCGHSNGQGKINIINDAMIMKAK